MRASPLGLLLAACAGPTPGLPSEGDDPCTEETVWVDADGDGYGDPFAATQACGVPDGHADNPDDCDDTDPAQRPGSTWYRDVDGDGFGDPDHSLTVCAQPVGYRSAAGDCDDADSGRYPGAVWYADADGDGFGDPDATVDACDEVSQATPNDGDCDDGDWLTHPDALEVCDGVDNDCDDRVDDADDDIDPYTQVPVFRDDDGDGYGTEESLGRACAGSGVGAELLGDCDDTDPDVHPHRLDYNDGVDSDCDGEAAASDLGAATGGWLGDVGSGFGVLVRSRDLDGDGMPELLVSAQNLDTDDVDEGGVHLISGADPGDRSGYPSEGARRWSGVTADGHLGASLDFVGDWDGDGVPDLVAAAPYADGNTGEILVWSTDAATGALSSPLARFPSPDAGAYFGFGLAAVGDIDGDGRDDVLAGARYDSRSGYRAGSVTLLMGGSTERTQDSLYGWTNGDQLGFTVAHLGDIDGDGVTDVGVSATNGDLGGSNAGEVAVLPATLLLESDPHLDAATAVLFGEQTNSYAGHGLAGAGDFNGDGLDDIVLGSGNFNLDDGESVNAGRAYVVLGRRGSWADHSDLADAWLVMDGAQADDRTGRYVSAPGDFDGDGFDDVFISAFYWSDTASRQGRSYGVLGRITGGHLDLEADAELIFEGEGTNDYAGRSVASAGDPDGDGVLDLFFAASGAGSTGAVYRVEGAPIPW